MFTLEQLHCKLRIASFPGSPGNEATLRIDTETLALFPACSMEMWEWTWWYLGIFPHVSHIRIGRMVESVLIVCLRRALRAKVRLN